MIRSLMERSATQHLQELEVYLQLPSTNQYLLKHARQGLNGPRACLAEAQTAGQGRHGKIWLSPFASGLCLSLLWTFKHSAVRLMGLSLVTGVIVAETLEQAGVAGIGLKWPNDLYCSGRKLAGILIDLVPHAAELTHGVIGVGINIKIPNGALDTIDQAWIDLATLGCYYSPNQLAANLLSNFLRLLPQFTNEGFKPFIAAWQNRDILKGLALKIALPNGQVIEGIGRGIDESGYLQLQTQQQILSFNSGEVTVRVGN